MEHGQIFAIAPAMIRTGWLTGLIVAVAVIVALAVGLAWHTVESAKNATFELGPAGLTIHGGLYGRTIPWHELDLGAARAVDLGRDKDCAPTWRTNGAALPGLRAGWFRLSGGGKALLFVTDPARVAFIPTLEGYSLLLSVTDPAAFLAALRAASATAR